MRNGSSIGRHPHFRGRSAHEPKRQGNDRKTPNVRDQDRSINTERPELEDQRTDLLAIALEPARKELIEG